MQYKFIFSIIYKHVFKGIQAYYDTKVQYNDRFYK